jgi:hypothetical protein
LDVFQRRPKANQGFLGKNIFQPTPAAELQSLFGGVLGERRRWLVRARSLSCFATFVPLRGTNSFRLLPKRLKSLISAFALGDAPLRETIRVYLCPSVVKTEILVVFGRL